MANKCINHPESNSLSLCHGCGEFFCSDCLTEGQEYYYCSKEACRLKMHEQEDVLAVEHSEPSPEIKLVTVQLYSHPYEANLARARLESEGIPAFVADEYIVNLNWFYSNAIGGIRLQVPENDAEAAKEILSKDESQDLNFSQEEESEENED